MNWPFGKRAAAEQPPPTATREVYELGGRRFVSIGESTVEHDDWFMVRIEQAGLSELALGEHERPDDFAVRVLRDVQRSGVANELIGALIVPEGTSGLEWTPAMAEEIAAHLAGLHTPRDKQVRNGLITSLLIHFFANGLISLKRSPGSSGKDDQPDLLELDWPTPTAAGERSSAPSPSTITSAQSG